MNRLFAAFAAALLRGWQTHALAVVALFITGNALAGLASWWLLPSGAAQASPKITGALVGGFFALANFSVFCGLLGLHLSWVIGQRMRGVQHQRKILIVQLALQRRRFEELTELGDDWWWETDANHRLINIHSRGLESLRMSTGRFLGLPWWELRQVCRDDPRELDKHILAMNAQEVFAVEYLFRGADGVVRSISIRGVPLFDSRGVFDGYCGVGADLTAQRTVAAIGKQNIDYLEDEVQRRTKALSDAYASLTLEVERRQGIETALRETQDELLHTSKLAILGTLAAGVSHEVNQPLAALKVLLGNAKLYLQAGRLAEMDTGLASMEAMVLRISRITQDLKRFARKTQPVIAPVSVAQAVNNALSLLAGRVKAEGVQLAIGQQSPGDGGFMAFDDTDIFVWAEDTRLEQVFVNIIRNALDAMEGLPQRCLEISWQKDTDPALVNIVFRDSGPGLSVQAGHKLFIPFSSSKPTGLGLGLTISKGIIEEFGGQIYAGNASQGGGEFTLRLRNTTGPAPWTELTELTEKTEKMEKMKLRVA